MHDIYLCAARDMIVCVDRWIEGLHNATHRSRRIVVGCYHVIPSHRSGTLRQISEPALATFDHDVGTTFRSAAFLATLSPREQRQQGKFAKEPPRVG